VLYRHATAMHQPDGDAIADDQLSGRQVLHGSG
jgi:hypothetical protein